MRLKWIPNAELYPIIYSLAIAITLAILVSLREARIDVYISLYILEYYILRAIISPLPIRVNRSLRVADVIFFIVFSVIVAYRVIQILAPDILWW